MNEIFGLIIAFGDGVCMPSVTVLSYNPLCGDAIIVRVYFYLVGRLPRGLS